MDIDLLRIIVTVASFACFLAIIGFALHPANRSRFEEAARMPLEDEENHV